MARIVQTVSKVPREGYVERLAACSDWRTLAVKVADRLDNLRSLRSGQVSPAFRARQGLADLVVEIETRCRSEA